MVKSIWVESFVCFKFAFDSAFANIAKIKRSRKFNCLQYLGISWAWRLGIPMVKCSISTFWPNWPFMFSVCCYCCTSLTYRLQFKIFTELHLQGGRKAVSPSLSQDWWWLLSPRAGHRNCPPKFKIVGRYWHDHSLERSWDTLSDGTITFSIHFRGKKSIFLIFLQKKSVLKVGNTKCHFTENKVKWRLPFTIGGL
jgi:hypothetical protein